ncbi:hypothetical protein, partial [Flavobacterium sp.]|uniref:hypothetical protein n=1 Tax=Flavobacterium sp. TaxID=239 RepID=UPI002625AC8F
MNLDELNKHYNTLSSFDNDVRSIERQLNKIKGRVDDVQENFYDFSKTLYTSSGKLLDKAENEYDIAGSAIIAATGGMTSFIGATFGTVGNFYADAKGKLLIKKLNSKKEEVAVAKIQYAEAALKWGEANIDKYITILKNDLSVNIKNCEDNEALYYRGRQLSFEICFKCIFIIKLSQNLIETYNSWIAKKYFKSVNSISEIEIIQNLLFGQNGLFEHKISKEKFIYEINKQPISAKYLLLLENNFFLSIIPLKSKEFISQTKKMDKSSVAYLTINDNEAFQNIVRIQKENINKRNKKIILFLSFVICIFFIISYWGLLG